MSRRIKRSETCYRGFCPGLRDHTNVSWNCRNGQRSVTTKQYDAGQSLVHRQVFKTDNDGARPKVKRNSSVTVADVIRWTWWCSSRSHPGSAHSNVLEKSCAHVRSDTQHVPRSDAVSRIRQPSSRHSIPGHILCTGDMTAWQQAGHILITILRRSRVKRLKAWKWCFNLNESEGRNLIVMYTWLIFRETQPVALNKIHGKSICSNRSSRAHEKMRMWKK